MSGNKPTQRPTRVTGKLTVLWVLAVFSLNVWPNFAQAVTPELWPAFKSPLGLDASIEQQIDNLLLQMSLEQKVGQVIQAEIQSVTPKDVRKYHLGSILNGGGSFPR